MLLALLFLLLFLHQNFEDPLLNQQIFEIEPNQPSCKERREDRLWSLKEES